MPSGWKTADGRNLKEAYWNTKRVEKDGIRYKVCRICTKLLPLDFFSKQKGVKIDGRRAICKDCSSTTKKAARYNVPVEQITCLVKRCGICSTQQNLVVDHDHETGKIREMLCSSCNTGIGLLREDLSLLEKAIAYLKRYRD